MIPRHAAPRLLRLLHGFPVVTLTWPRQSGKTTLVRALRADKPYVSLDCVRSLSQHLVVALDGQAHLEHLGSELGFGFTLMLRGSPTQCEFWFWLYCTG